MGRNKSMGDDILELFWEISGLSWRVAGWMSAIAWVLAFVAMGWALSKFNAPIASTPLQAVLGSIRYVYFIAPVLLAAIGWVFTQRSLDLIKRERERL